MAEYVIAANEEKKLKNRLMHVLRDLDEVMKRKADAERIVKEEFAFMSGEKTVKPPIDGAVVATTLIRGVLEEFGRADEILTFLRGDDRETIRKWHADGMKIDDIVKNTGHTKKYVEEILEEGSRK